MDVEAATLRAGEPDAVLHSGDADGSISSAAALDRDAGGDDSTTAAGPALADAASGDGAEHPPLAEVIEPDVHEDADAAEPHVDALALPAAALVRLAKAKLPPGFSISKDGKASLSRATSTFILYLTAAANEVCHAAKRSTLTGADVMAALAEVELPQLQSLVSEGIGASKRSKSAKRRAAPAPRRTKSRAVAAATAADADGAALAPADAPVEDAVAGGDGGGSAERHLSAGGAGDGGDDGSGAAPLERPEG